MRVLGRRVAELEVRVAGVEGRVAADDDYSASAKVARQMRQLRRYLGTWAGEDAVAVDAIGFVKQFRRLRQFIKVWLGED